MAEIPGQLFDGIHSSPFEARIQLNPDGESIQIATGESYRTFAFRDIISLEKTGPSFRCTLKNPDGDEYPHWALTYQDAPFHTALNSRHLHSRHPLRRTFQWVGELTWWKWALLTIVVLILFFRLAIWGLQYAYQITPDAYDLHLGNKVDSIFSQWTIPCQSPELDSFFIKGLTQLALPTDRFPHRVFVLNDPTENAIAIPGGTIYVFRGLLDSSASPDEVLGVVAHEISHSELRHTVRQIIQSTGMSYLIALTVGMAIDGMDLLESLESTVEMGSALLTLRYSRHFESEADSLGIIRMHRAHLKVGPLDTLLTRLSPKPRLWDRLLGWLSTHPLNEERSRRFKAAAALESFQPDTTFSRERQNWDKLKRSCIAVNDSTPLWKKVVR